jgi:chromosome segregation ATPase
MTKQQLQKELKEKVTAGVKPSDIKKLKRSKSADDIANPPTPLLADQLTQKQKELERLKKESETKSTTIRLLREKLDRDTKEQEIKELKEQLDNSLEARTQALKDYAKQHEQIKTLNQELNETIDQASSELDKGDTEISQLRTTVYQLKNSNESLNRQLKLARINRPNPPNSLPTDYAAKLDYLPSALYALMAV